MLRTSLSLLLVGTATLVACSPRAMFNSQSHQELELTGPEQKIISDRPIQRENFIATVKLSEPALLEGAEQKSGKLEIDPQAKAAVEKEQSEFIAKLKAIAPNIQVIYRYRMILNGVAFSAPWSAKDQIESLGHVIRLEPAVSIARPQIMRGPPSNANEDLTKHNSVSFIEATQIHENLKSTDEKGQSVAVNGHGVRVGVIDTGIDYTHKMLGGSGDAKEFKAIKPSEPSASFPNKKVVGGVDLVGSEFNSASELWTANLPKPDANPIDEAGHGSHVAGTIAGLGDNVQTYSGVAPDAELYAIKVFGANGSTSDFVVVAALEYAADPNLDGDPADRLDVVNLSLGGGFGQPQILYTEAIRNLTRGGTVVVASAGNSGPTNYIVGAPSTADDAISVAASIDDMPHNWTYDAVRFTSKSSADRLARAVECAVCKKISEIGDVQGELVYIGLGDQPLSDDVKAKLKGKVAFIDRGKVPFLQKLQLAVSGGAIGAVVANNQPGEPIPMGGEGSVGIPGIMVSKDLGDQLKADMQSAPATVQFKTGRKIEDPSKIDTITDFSSKGPRSIDSLLKPEITAPGYNIISAMMGEGDKGVQYSGTSMSGPHIAGVMALLRQYHPELSVTELKSLLMTSSKKIHDTAGVDYPLSMQGAGRVRSYSAATMPLLVKTPALSLGTVPVGQSKMLRRTIELKNISTSDLIVKLRGSKNTGMEILTPTALSIGKGASLSFVASVILKAPSSQQPQSELDGEIEFLNTQNEVIAHVPVLAIVTQLSNVVVDSLKVYASGESDSVGAAADLALTNRGAQPGQAFAFNLIALDDPKPQAGVRDSYKSRSCDLDSAGYRIIRKTVDGEEQDMFQVAVKIREPLTTWHYCEISVQIDSNNDQKADQELVGISRSNLSGLGGGEFSSLLLDANKARDIRMKYEQDLAAGKEGALSYVDAILDVQPMLAFSQSTLAIIETPLKALKLRPTGELAVKVAVLSDSDAIEPDDFLANELAEWHRLDPRAAQTGFYDMAEIVNLAPGQSTVIPMTRGAGRERLVVYMPQNQATGSLVIDRQVSLPKPNYSLAAAIGTANRK